MYALMPLHPSKDLFCCRTYEILHVQSDILLVPVYKIPSKRLTNVRPKVSITD